MKKILCILLFCVCSGVATYAQGRYVISLTDKNNSPYSIANPSAYLSQRAINRRTAQNIAITVQDLPVNPAYVSGIAGTGAQILNTSKWFNTVTVYVSGNNMLNDINNLPYVATSINVGKITATPLPSKFDFENERSMQEQPGSSQRTTTLNYGQSFNQVSMLKGDLMHDNGYTGTGMIIAVLDAGFINADAMPIFDSLFMNNHVLSTWDFVDNETDVYDDDTHGTMVLSTMAANSPGEMIGTAPGADYILLRSENAVGESIIEEYNWASAAEYADSAGADIINSSLGYTVFDDFTQNHTYSDLDGNTTPVTRAADIAASKGMVVCNSAGNEGNSGWFHISAPADADSVLTVGAVDPFSMYAQFSGKGPSADGRVKPNVAAQGSQCIVADPWNGVGVFPANGTSFSSPLMAGMVATLWQCHPLATNMQIINAIQASGNQASNPDSLLGYGIPDFPVACLLLAGLNPGSVANGEDLIINGNPFTDQPQASFYSNTGQEIEVTLTDMLGKTIYRSTQRVVGLNVTPVNLPVHVSKGVYVLEVKTDENLFSEKLLRQ